MKIFGKHIFRSIKVNPRQPILITLIVSICVTVMILSVILPLNIYKNERARMLTDEWTADLEVTLKATSDRRLIFSDEVENAINGRGRVIGEFALTGFYTPEKSDTKHQVNIGAFDLVDAYDFYSLQRVEYGKITNTNLKSAAIIGEMTARDFGLSVGDNIGINVLGQEFFYTVQAIVKDTGIMKREDILVDISSVRAALSERSPLIASLSSDFKPYTVIQIKLNDGIDPNAIKTELEELELFGDKRIVLPSDSSKTDYVATLLTVTTVIPAVLLLIVAAMMTVSTFDLLQKKRQDDIALFKSIGADSRQLNKALYFESAIYGLIGGAIGVVLYIPISSALNGLYSFKYSWLGLGIAEVLLGICSSLLFSSLCTYLHIRRQKGKSVTEGLKTEKFNTDKAFRLKITVFGVLILTVSVFTAILSPTVKYIGAFGLLLVLVVFLYLVSPYIIRCFASVVSRLLSKRRFVSGDLILSAKSCENSYPLRHAGRIITVLITIFMSFSSVLSAVEEQIESYREFPVFEYAGIGADKVTKEKVAALDGITAISEASIANNVIFEGGKAAMGISAVGDVENCFSEDILPDKMPTENTIALSKGFARMLDLKVGDTVKCEISGIPCELILVEIINVHGNFAFYDASYIGSGYDMLCIRTDDSDAAYQELTALLDERGVACISKDEAFLGIYNKIDSQIVIFKVLFFMMIIMTVIGIINVLAEQRMARRREFEIMVQNGKTARGILSLQTVEILYLILFALIVSAVFSHILCLAIDTAAVSFGMTLYA